MTVDITQEELDLFTKNGISQEDIRQTINNYRSDGLSDIDIRAKFDNKLNSFRGQRSGYTYPNQDVKNMNPEEFKRSVDKLYDIPQVPIPQRGTLVNSDGVPMETVADVMSNTAEPSKKTFAQSHPIIASVPETVGTFGRAAKKSYYDFGTGVNDLLTLAGDKTGIKGLSDFGRSNAQFWQQRSGDVDQRINDKYQKLAGLTDASTVLPTIANAIGSQATNLLMAAGGGAGAGTLAKAAGLGKVGTGIATTAGTAVPNLAQEGQYLDKIEAFKNIYGRVPTKEELRVIQNVAMGEKATNAALETISDKLLFGKLFPQGVATKGAKDVLKNIGKQAVTEAGTEGMQEGVSIGAEKLLGINQGDNLARLGEAAGMGGLTGGILGGGATLASQPYDSQITAEPIEALKEVSAQILDNGKAIYDSANQPSGFDVLRQLSKEGAYTNPSVEEIAPNTYQKQQAKKAPVVKKWDIEALPHITSEEAQNVKNWDIDALPRVKSVEEQIAPKTVAKQQAKALEKAEKTEEARNSVVENIAPNTANKEVVDVDAKIAELERKMKLVGGEKTQLGQKYKRQIEELRGTEQAVAPVTEEVKPVTEETVKPVENIPSKTEEVETLNAEIVKDNLDLTKNEAVMRGLPIEEAQKQIDKLHKGKEYRINNAARVTFTGEFDTEGMPIFESSEGNKQGFSLTNVFEEIKSTETSEDLENNIYKERSNKDKKVDENRHQKVIDLEDKAYKEFKTMYDNYINGDVKVSDFGKAKEQFNKKYKKEFEKLDSDRFASFEDLAKRENKDITETTETTKPAEAQEVAEKPKKTPKKAEKSTKTIEDSGEFLLGNRKIDKSLTWNDLDEMNDLVRAKNTTKAKIYAAPKFDDLKTEGYSDFGASLIINVYKKINAKPASGYTGKENEKLYVDMVNETMKTVKDYIKNNPEKFTNEILAERTGSVNPYNYHYKYDNSLFEAVFPDKENKVGQYGSVFRQYPEYNRKALIVGGSKFVDALRIDYHTLKDVSKVIEEAKTLKDEKTGEKVNKKDWEKNFIVLQPSRWDNSYAVAFKKGKQIIAKFNTKEEAELAAQRVFEKLREERESEKNQSSYRKYSERRANGKNITAQELQDAFGFRGVNFGNWVNQKERQSFLNNTYDSLFDLAELLNLPPKALSLNNELGIAFGAQGHGKGSGAAHYIPAFKEINLTKDYGAGSLAHEWWHALDNYLGNQASGKEFSENWALSIRDKGELREELFNVLKNLQDQIKTAPFTKEDITRNLERTTARINRNIDRYAEHLKNSYKRAKNSEDLFKIIDDLANNREKYKTYSFEEMSEMENKFFNLLPKNRDTISNRGEFSWLTGEIRRLSTAEEIANRGGKKTKYLEDAEKLDKQEGKTYWAKDTELGARAFSVWLLDKMENQSIVNRFLVRQEKSSLTIDEKTLRQLVEGKEDDLSYIAKTPIVTEERQRIFKGFDKLFETIKTRETEKGVELYDIEVPSWMNNYQYTTQGYKNIDLEILNDLIAKGCTQDELLRVLPSDLQTAFRNIEGYKFYNLKNGSRGIQFGGNVKRIGINLSMVGNNPRRFVNTLIHELEHADQEAYYNYLKGKDHLTPDEIDYIEAYEENDKLNHEIQEYLKKNKTKIDNIVNPFIKKHINLSEKDFYNEISNIKNKSKRDIIIKHIEYLGKYFNLFREIGAYQEGMKYSEVYIDEEREIQQGINGRNKSVKNSSTNRNIGAAIRARFKGRNGNYAIGEPTKGTQEPITKERGAIKTLNKYDKEMAEAITEKEYEVRSLDKVAEEVRNMSEKELDDVLNSDRSTDTKSLALAQSIKSSIDNGEVPVTKLNKWAVEGTDIGQAMQARKAIAPETVEEAVIKMHTYNTENVKPAVKKLINDSDKIVKEMTNEEIEKQFNEWLAKQDETPAKKQYSQYGDRLALLKAMERYRNTKERQKIREFQRNEERKRKAVERLVNERLKNSDRKVRADLIDNILKLENNEGLTSDNVAKLIMKMFKVKTVSPADVAELKKLSSKIKNASTQRDEDIAKAMMQKYIIDNSIGSSAWDKISAIRYINMLGGTAQRFLDFVSTGVYQVVRLGDNFVTMVIDKTASKVLGTEEVTSGFYAPEYYQGFMQGVQEGYFDTIQGINTGRAGETARYDLNKPNAFRYRPLNMKKGFIAKSLQGVENAFSVAEKITNGMIKIPDRAYFQARYNTSLLDQLNSRGVNTKRFQKLKGATLSETLTNIAKPEEVEQAILEARENVFQRDCVASKFARNIRNGLNSLTPYQIGDWALPFIHTTSVISEDIIDRIGVGLIKGSQKIYDINKNGGSSRDLRDAYNSIAKSIIGIGIIALGAAKGEDEEKSYTDKEITGEYSNAVNIKNVSINAKNIPFILVPYNLGKMLMSNDEQKIKKAVLKTWEAIAETNPVLSKYNEMSKKNKFGNKDEKDILDEFIADTLGVPLAQLFQNATLRNIRNITDEYDRETYVPDNKWATLGNKFKNATPGLSQTLPKKYNAIGEEVKRNNIDNPLEKAVSAFITGHKRLKPENETYNEFKKIGKGFENTDYKGKGNIAMAKIKRGVKVNGENYKMSPEEYSNFQRDYGRINYYFRRVLSDSSFMNKDAKSFVDDISEIKQSAEEAVKIKQLGHIPSKYKNGKYRLHKYTEYMLKNYDILTQ